MMFAATYLKARFCGIEWVLCTRSGGTMGELFAALMRGAEAYIHRKRFPWNSTSRLKTPAAPG